MAEVMTLWHPCPSCPSPNRAILLHSRLQPAALHLNNLTALEATVLQATELQARALEARALEARALVARALEAKALLAKALEGWALEKTSLTVTTLKVGRLVTTIFMLFATSGLLDSLVQYSLTVLHPHNEAKACLLH